MNINHAILHVFDFGSQAGNSFSARELDMGDKVTKSFVQRHLRKVGGSPDNKHGEFLPESAFVGEFRRYLSGGNDFVTFSMDIADYLYGQLRLVEGMDPCDLLVCDYEDDPEKASSEGTSEGAPEGGEPAGEMAGGEGGVPAVGPAADPDPHGRRIFAVMLLPRKQAFVHVVATEGGQTENRIARHDATLPGPAQKVDSYALVDVEAMTVAFNDKKRTVAGVEVAVIPDCLLGCSAKASCRDVVETVTRIVEQVAEEYGSNTAVAMSKAKALVAEKVDQNEYLPPWELGEEVFEDEPAMRQRFEESARESDLPERVPMKRSVANRMAKSHRIRTDTGIEITFPSEYSSNPEFIEFVTEADGSISIELKNIGSIENR